MPLLQTFEKKYGAKGFLLHSTIRRQREVRKEDYDVMFTYEPYHQAAENEVSLFQESLTPICSPDLIKHNPLQSPEDLATHTLLHAYSDRSEWAHWLAACGCSTVDSTRGIDCGGLDRAVRAAVDGIGVALADKVVNYNDIVGGKLLTPLETVVPTGFAYYLTWRVETPAVHILRDEFVLPACRMRCIPNPIQGM